MPEQIAITPDDSLRLLVEPWENAHRRRLVKVTLQHQNRAGQWRLAHSGPRLSPEAASDGCSQDGEWCRNR